MKILIVHNEYRVLGGEEIAVNNKIKILEENGIQVKLFSKKNKTINSIWKKIKVAFSLIYSFKIAKEFDKIIKNYNPDLIEVHNFFFIISPSIFFVAKKRKVPIIWCIHNYRIICGSSFTKSNNQCCESCKGNFFLSIFKRCYQNSFIGSLILSINNVIHKSFLKTWLKKIDYFIVMNKKNIKYYTMFGIPKRKIKHLPHFSYIKTSPPKNKDEFGLFVGRFSKEKGILTLLKAWDKIDYPLKLIGELNSYDKDLKKYLNKKNKNIQNLGFINNNEIYKYYEKASFTIFPSEWAEPYGLVIIESFANSTPVIASNHYSLKELIINNYNGIFFETGNVEDLKRTVFNLINNQDKLKKMQINAYNHFNKYHSPHNHFKSIKKFYKNTINNY